MNRLLRIVSLFLILTPAVAQEDTPFDRGRWRELREEIRFEDGNAAKKKTVEESGTRGNERESRPISRQRSTRTINLGPAVQIVLILVFIAFIVILLYQLIIGSGLLSRQQKLASDSGDLNIDDLDEIPIKSDLERWLERALADRDYRLAIRISFLIILKTLDVSGAIRWQKEKTNRHYFYELEGHHLQYPFLEVADAFDLVWYGEKQMDENQLRDQLAVFDTVRTRLNDSGDV